MTPRKDVRTRKARARSTCGACRTAILPGQQITSQNRQPFVHIQCFLAERLPAGPFPARRPGTDQAAQEREVG